MSDTTQQNPLECACEAANLSKPSNSGQGQTMGFCFGYYPTNKTNPHPIDTGMPSITTSIIYIQYHSIHVVHGFSTSTSSSTSVAVQTPIRIHTQHRTRECMQKYELKF